MELMGKTQDMDSTPDTRLLRMDSGLLSMISTLQKLALEKHSQEAQVRMVDIDAQISELTIKGAIDTLSSDEHTVLLNLTASKQRIISELHTLSTSDLTEVVTKDEQVEFLCSHATLILAILTEVTSRPIKPRSTFETGTDKGLSEMDFFMLYNHNLGKLLKDTKGEHTPMRIKMSALFKTARKALGYSQENFVGLISSKGVAITIDTLSNYERQKTNINIDCIIAIFKLLEEHLGLNLKLNDITQFEYNGLFEQCVSED